MAKTISQRISLEGSDDIRKKLQELGVAGEKAFKQIQDAAAKPITDPAQIDRTKQAFDQLAQAVAKLSPQFKALAGDSQQFGAAGTQATAQVTSGLNQTSQAAEQTGAGFRSATDEANKLGIRIGVVAGLVTAATNKLIGVLGQLRSALSPGEALKGTVETGKAIGEQAEKLKLAVPEWLKLRQAITEAGVSEESFISGTSKLAKTIDDAKKKLAEGKGGGGFVEVMPGTLVSTSKGAVAVFTDLAKSISMLGDSAQAAKLGTAAFGENWKDIIKALTGRQVGKVVEKAADDIFDTLAKVDRAMRPDQAEKAARLAKAWDILGKAIRAAKDQIGTVLLDTALLRAEWLIRLIDGSRELFKTWQQLADAKKAAFLEGLGDSPVEMLFKTLIAVSDQLAGIWRDVLVPAGKALWGIIGQIAGSFEGVSKSQIAAFFITAAIAAGTLALALKGISLLLTPLSLLFSLLFSPLGAVLLAAGAAALLFWDQISEGAAKAAALIPVELTQIKEAIKKLFTGDFAGAWDQFAAAAKSAFEKIRAAAEKTEIWSALIKGFNRIKDEVPGTIKLIIGILSQLDEAAKGVAAQINKIFGTKLTGTDIGVITVLGQMTGAFQLLGTAVGIVAGGLIILSTSITLVGQAIRGIGVLAGGLAAALGIPFGLALAAVLALIVGLALLIIYWPEIKQAALDAWAAIKQKGEELKAWLDTWIGTPVANAWQWIKDTFNDAVIWVGTKIEEAKGWITAWVTTPVANAWQWIKDSFNDALSWIVGKWNAAKQAFGFGAGGGEPGSVTPAPGNASGGYIRGPGSATSDSILARLSNGEFVLSARATKFWGVDFMRALNSLQTPRFSMGGFAGLSAPHLPRFAEGGLVGAMAHLGTLDLRTDHGSAKVMATADAVTQLQRLAVQKRISSTGRKPGFIS